MAIIKKLVNLNLFIVFIFRLKIHLIIGEKEKFSSYHRHYVGIEMYHNLKKQKGRFINYSV
ncbi:MAG TPA: hypothetical protein DDX98_08465 [Bacteroidales bacterium]|nr:hypothetical protein [Bacteroidales bacterium]